MNSTITYRIIDTVSDSFNYSINVSQLNGSTLYQFMEKAQEMDEHFKFNYKDNPKYGKFITSINGLINIESQNLYWMFYSGDQPLKVGVSTFRPKCGDHIVAKYEKV
ncbi:cobalamin binding intrinsic factor-like [Scyliorhinus torazame]|uniref:cobalamin binding intrinsic factor-like n=1 Tax=Scyliorhinus torazame TaxID=75743 RepID=UPI003B58F47E